MSVPARTQHSGEASCETMHWSGGAVKAANDSKRFLSVFCEAKVGAIVVSFAVFAKETMVRSAKKIL